MSSKTHEKDHLSRKVLRAFHTDTFSLAPSVTLSVPHPFVEEGHLCLPPSEKAKEVSLDVLESRLKETSLRGSSLVLSLDKIELHQDLQNILSVLHAKGAHLVLNAGDITETESWIAKRDFVEQTLKQPCGLLFHLKKLPWAPAAPFVFKALMRLSTHTTLFLALGKWCLPSSILADISWAVQSTQLSMATDVQCVPIFSTYTTFLEGNRFEIPFLQELERIYLELNLSRSIGIAMLEEYDQKPLCIQTQKELLQRSFESHLSLRAYLRTLLQKCGSLDEAHQVEENLVMLENLLLSHKEKVSEEVISEMLTFFQKATPCS